MLGHRSGLTLTSLGTAETCGHLEESGFEQRRSNNLKQTKPLALLMRACSPAAAQKPDRAEGICRALPRGCGASERGRRRERPPTPQVGGALLRGSERPLGYFLAPRDIWDLEL